MELAWFLLIVCWTAFLAQQVARLCRAGVRMLNAQTRCWKKWEHETEQDDDADWWKRGDSSPV